MSFKLLIFYFDIILLFLLKHISNIVGLELFKEVLFSCHLFNSTSNLFFSAQMFMVHFVKLVVLKVRVFVLFLRTIFEERIIVLSLEGVFLFEFDLLFNSK